MIGGTGGMEIIEQMDPIKLIEVMVPMELNALNIAAGTCRKLVELFDSIE